MELTDPAHRFAQQLTAAQSRLYAYIFSLLPDADRAQDVLQEANLVMLRKSAEYPPSSDFVAWACKVAYYEVLSHRRDRARDRHRFDEAFLARIAEATRARADGFDDRRRALHACLKTLTADQRDLLTRRYAPRGSVKEISLQLGRPVGSISQSLYRIRHLLLDCVRHRLAKEPS